MDPKDSNRDGSRRKPTGGVEGRAMENGVAAAGQRGSEAEGVAAGIPLTAAAPPALSRRGLAMQRYFTEPGVDPYAGVEWERRSAVIYGEKGEVVFEQHDVEIPKPWTQLATNVVVSKYFRGPLATPQRERSVRQLIGRVVDTIRSWGVKQGYFQTPADAAAFADELTHLLLHQ